MTSYQIIVLKRVTAHIVIKFRMNTIEDHLVELFSIQSI